MASDMKFIPTNEVQPPLGALLAGDSGSGNLPRLPPLPNEFFWGIRSNCGAPTPQPLHPSLMRSAFMNGGVPFQPLPPPLPVPVPTFNPYHVLAMQKFAAPSYAIASGMMSRSERPVLPKKLQEVIVPAYPRVGEKHDDVKEAQTRVEIANEARGKNQRVVRVTKPNESGRRGKVKIVCPWVLARIPKRRAGMVLAHSYG